jgi:glucose/arabinose dehydrogenase
MAARPPWRAVTLLLVALTLTADACGRSPDQAPPGRPGSAAGPTSTAPARSGMATAAPAGPPTQAELDRVVVRLDRLARLREPVALAVAGDDATLLVGERGGRVRAVRDGRVDPRPLLDLSDQVVAEGEGGLLGLAVAPDRHELFVSFTDRRHALRVVGVALNGDGVDPASQREILTVAQPSTRHHGGNLVFGPDGLLWIGVGDGSEGGDRDDAAQSLAALSGKLLRLDPTPTRAKGYRVPAGNPFVGRPGARPEVWAYGLRNPWRFSFDRATGDLWIGDVGQFIVEEIDAVPLRRSAGANFGWNRLEGRRRFHGRPPPRALPPVHQYNHDDGRCAVVGGHVYRGTQIRGLQGAYLYGDVCDGRIRALARTRGQASRHRDLGLRLPGLVSFAENRAGELYALSLAGGVYRLQAAA